MKCVRVELEDRTTGEVDDAAFFFSATDRGSSAQQAKSRRATVDGSVMMAESRV
jgi:hypothetical protein